MLRLVCKVIAMEIHGYSEMTIKWTKYLSFVILMAARLSWVVELAWTSSGSLPQALNRLFWWIMCFFFVVATFADFWRGGVIVMWLHFVVFAVALFTLFLFLLVPSYSSCQGVHKKSLFLYLSTLHTKMVCRRPCLTISIKAPFIRFFIGFFVPSFCSSKLTVSTSSMIIPRFLW